MGNGKSGTVRDESPPKGKRGLVRVWNTCRYSLAGLGAAFKHEDAFRQEVLLAFILIPVALFLTADGCECIACIGRGTA
jgi:diacylglycerol kinase (ATP)